MSQGKKTRSNKGGSAPRDIAVSWTRSGSRDRASKTSNNAPESPMETPAVPRNITTSLDEVVLTERIHMDPVAENATEPRTTGARTEVRGEAHHRHGEQLQDGQEQESEAYWECGQGDIRRHRN